MDADRDPVAGEAPWRTGRERAQLGADRLVAFEARVPHPVEQERGDRADRVTIELADGRGQNTGQCVPVGVLPGIERVVRCGQRCAGRGGESPEVRLRLLEERRSACICAALVRLGQGVAERGRADRAEGADLSLDEHRADLGSRQRTPSRCRSQYVGDGAGDVADDDLVAGDSCLGTRRAGVAVAGVVGGRLRRVGRATLVDLAVPAAAASAPPASTLPVAVLLGDLARRIDHLRLWAGLRVFRPGSPLGDRLFGRLVQDDGLARVVGVDTVTDAEHPGAHLMDDRVAGGLLRFLGQAGGHRGLGGTPHVAQQPLPYRYLCDLLVVKRTPRIAKHRYRGLVKGHALVPW